jgi:hypothetical protein
MALNEFHEDGCYHRRRGLCRRCAADYAAYLDELRAEASADWDALLTAGKTEEDVAEEAARMAREAEENQWRADWSASWERPVDPDLARALPF